MRSNPLWFKDAIIYEVPVRAFFDSNDDGIGDFRGFTQKLDYLQELGITAVWILPFFPSPLRDDGYDISDYAQVSSIYGTLDDFKAFLDAAHQRGIRVIIELILNHTSDQHPWFQRARRALKGSVDRDFYVWNDAPDRYPETRIIFQDFESSNWAWDSVANAYYWHRFYSHQPDLNYDNPAVCQAVFEVLDFWLEMGVDGLRLDAVPYLYERDGTNCENLPETHQFLKQIRQHIDAKFPDRMLLAEANQWSEDAVEYFGNGDECHMNFHFPLMPRLFMSLRMEDSFPIVDILHQTPTIPDNCQWALFLRNHDELTLEMVTDEDRDFMYQVYAQDPMMRHNLGIRRRLAPLLGNDRRQIELLNSLLLSLPGTPVLYYGDEIGMGDNIYVGDRNGVRTPMQWSNDRNAGFSRANSQQLYLPVIVESEYHYAAVNVETQRANPNSLWFAIRRLIAVRKRHKALGSGTFKFLHPANRKVIAFTRTDGDEQILVVANLSRFVQTVELDLSKFVGRVPIELFGQTEFPTISGEPYFLSLSPYACYWFNLKPDVQPSASQILLSEPWQSVFTQPESKLALETVLTTYLTTRSWFNGHDRRIQSTQIIEVIPVVHHELDAQIIWLQVDYLQGTSDTYLLVLTCVEEEQASSEVVAHLQIQGKDTIATLLDITADQRFLRSLRDAIMNSDRVYSGVAGALHFALNEDEITNDQNLILNFFHTVEEGIHPDVEIRRFLSQKTNHVVPLAGVLEYRRSNGNGMAIGTLQPQIQDAQSGWDYTLDRLRDFFEQVIMLEMPTTPSSSLLELLNSETPDLAVQTIDAYLASVQQLGQITAELHRALASDLDNPHFAPQPFSSLYQRSLYQQSRNLTGRVFILLKERLDTLPSTIQPMAQAVLDRHEEFLERFRSITASKITAQRIRCHGDYQLRQLLYTGRDFLIVNFEGDRSRSLSERRIQRSPLSDVASLLLSFHDASSIALANGVKTGILQAESLPLMEQWAELWVRWVSTAFLKSYFATTQIDRVLPQAHEEMTILSNVYLLEKAITSLGSGLVNAPDRVSILLRRLLRFQQIWG